MVADLLARVDDHWLWQIRQHARHELLAFVCGYLARSLAVVRASTVPATQTALNFSLGGSNSTGTAGAATTTTTSGDIATAGADTPGQIVQSIGGGGGRATIALDVSQATPASLALGLGGSNQASSGGGALTVSQTGLIQTSGDLASGAVLQSTQPLLIGVVSGR